MERATITIQSEDVELVTHGGRSVITYPKSAAVTSGAATYRLQTVYQTLEDVQAEVAKAQPHYNVLASDGSVATKVPGSGSDTPDLVYEKTGDALPVYRCITLVHPYWKEVEGIVNPTEPGPTQVTETFVPGVSSSTNMTGAPMPPKQPPAADEPPSAPPNTTPPRDPTTLTFRKIAWGSDSQDTQGAYGQDVLQFPFSVPAGASGTISFGGVDFPAGATPHSVRIMRGADVVIDEPNWATSIVLAYKVPGQLPPGDYMLCIGCHGEAWRPANIRLDSQVTA